MHIEYSLKLKNNLLVVAILTPFITLSIMLIFIAEGVVSQLFLLLIVCLFSLVAGASLRVLLRKKPGLIINDEGIINHSGIPSIGFIDWKDVESIEWTGPWLCVYTSNHDKYMDGNLLSRLMKKYNAKHLGTPIFINVQNLKCDDLDRLIDQLYTAWENNERSSQL